MYQDRFHQTVADVRSTVYVSLRRASDVAFRLPREQADFFRSLLGGSVAVLSEPGARHGVHPRAEHRQANPGRTRRKPVIIRFDENTLEWVDRAAAKRGLSRSALVRMLLLKHLPERIRCEDGMMSKRYREEWRCTRHLAPA